MRCKDVAREQGEMGGRSISTKTKNYKGSDYKTILKISCSWSTTYEDLLSTHEPFSESIPLPEMVDFLVDIWYDEGLYD
ncbi:unnamed protein product [Thlaspi arvense]|uniref:Gag1-like clamp domain-containing protein n=1 Tax=Thlaspi arvense TaxID=13288 RepID=A0AAU9SDK8_THLAR|nr:unnamed protein product [Thlaspi arvense]